jgi:STE24 endopeptidase
VSLPPPGILLLVFIVLSLAREALEAWLAALNRRYYRNPEHQQEAIRVLALDPDDLARSLAYAEDRYSFTRLSGWLRTAVGLAFIAFGGMGLVERVALGVAAPLTSSPVAVGLLFFGIIGFASDLLGLPLDYHATFRIEARHGFNRQTMRGFFVDRLKSWAITAVLGGIILAAVLAILAKGGAWWWVWAWLAVSGVSLVTLFVYPRWLAPLFNRFTPLPDGELARDIRALAERIGFHAGGIFVMDASRRTAHGNAYFTGLGREKRIVLFDTLVEMLTTRQIVAVLAHELGHFKLHHVRSQLFRAVALTGGTFYLLSLTIGLTPFYEAFALSGPSPYGALVVFGAWFGLVDFVLQPAGNVLSRRNEFAADRFAVVHHEDASDLVQALLRLREKSRLVPLVHPWFSWIYYSHPPLIERLKALGHGGGTGSVAG